MDIAIWLRGLGLERYELAFRNNEIDRETLPKLTAEDLKDLGVVLGGHRRKLLAAIAALQGGAAPSMQLPSAAERRQLTVMFCDLVGSTELDWRKDMLTFDKWGLTAMSQSAHSLIDRQGRPHGSISALLDGSV